MAGTAAMIRRAPEQDSTAGVPFDQGFCVEVLTETLWNKGLALDSLLERSRHEGTKRVRTLPKPRRRQKHLTRSERVEVAKRYESGESMSALASAFGCHRSAIRRAVDHFGVERRDWRTRKVDVVKARALYEAGHTAAQIAAAFDVSATAVLNHLRRAGVVVRPRGKVSRPVVAVVAHWCTGGGADGGLDAAPHP